MKVLKPQRLKRNIEDRLKGAVDLYDSDISSKGLEINRKRLKHKGFNILNQVFTHRSLRKIDGLIYNHIKKQKIDTSKNFEINDLFAINENIEGLIYSESFVKVLKSINSSINLKNVSYFDYNKDFSQEWKQGENSLQILILLSAFSELKG